MRKLMIVLFMSMFLISLTSASISNLGTFKQNDCIDLPQTCPDCTYNNISRVVGPRQNILIKDVVMQKDDTYHNYTVCNTSVLGTYKVNGYGDVAGVKTIWNYIFEVTADGRPSSPFPIQFVIIILGLILIVGGIFVEKLRLLQVVGAMITIIMGILTLYPGYSFINWGTLLGKAIGFGLIGIGIYFLLSPAFSRDDQDESYTQEEDEYEYN